jgi:5'-nucleotidase
MVRMNRPRILITNDDGWDAPGLAALKALAAEIGEVCVLAPLEPHSYAGHRVTTDATLILSEAALCPLETAPPAAKTNAAAGIGPREFTLSGTPADCVRVALTTVFPDVDWVLAGINRGGNLGADLFTSGTVAAAREAALLGKPAIAISQYIRKGLELDWNRSRALARPVLERIMADWTMEKPGCHRAFWNVNLPHLDPGDSRIPPVIECDPDNLPLDVRYRRDGCEIHYSGSYPARPRTPGRDVDQCFAGSITLSRLTL